MSLDERWESGLNTQSPDSWLTDEDRGLLQEQEMARARSFGLIVCALCVIVLISLPFLGGHLVMSVVCATALVTLGLSSVVVWWYAQKPEAYTRSLFRVYGALSVLAATAIQFHLGWFSPTPLVVVLGMGFFAQGGDGRGAWAICGSAMAIYLLFAGMTAVGVLPDVGIISSASSLEGRLFFVVMVPLVELVCLLQGRTNRNSIVHLEIKAAQGARQIGLEQVRYQELRQQLEAALEQGRSVRGLRTGTTVGGYFLGGLIGRGGTAEIYAARRLDDGQTRALKILHRMGDEFPRMRERFEREAQLASTIDNEHVVRLHDYGATEDGMPFLTMDHLDGRDLSNCLRDRPRMSEAELVRLVQQITRGLGAIHQAGIIHRDIQPKNLFLAHEPSGAVWKILDFGLARGLELNTMTQGEILGTPGYMSPEQAGGYEVDHRTDLYSMCMVIYRAALGRPPFWSRTAVATIAKIVNGRPIRPRSIVPDLSRDLELFFAVGLALREKDRFQSAQEVRHTLVRALRQELSDEFRKHARSVIQRQGWDAETGGPRSDRAD